MEQINDVNLRGFSFKTIKNVFFMFKTTTSILQGQDKFWTVYTRRRTIGFLVQDGSCLQRTFGGKIKFLERF